MRKTLFSLLAILTLNLALVGACKKPPRQPDEDGAVYKKRLAGIYLGKAAVGLRAASDATAVLVGAQKLSKDTAISIYNADDKAADVLSVLADRVKAGFADQSTITKLDAVIQDVQKIEDLGILNLTETARNQFIIITGGIRASLATLRAVLLSQQEPGFAKQGLTAKAEIERALQASNPQWVFDLVQVVLIAYGDAEALNNQPSVDAAFAAVATIITTVKSLNVKRRAELG